MCRPHCVTYGCIVFAPRAEGSLVGALANAWGIRLPSLNHVFYPLAQSPAGAGPIIRLSIREIETAGVLEVLQAPGAALGSWAILGALLDPATRQLVFREPLGQSREVKTALSALFGRFVARAYLTRYLGLSQYVHITKPPMRISGVAKARVERLALGDMPDWIAWNLGRRDLAIAEAKGCHDRQGPSAALGRAWTQAQRAEVKIGGKRVSVKRFAIATRWGVASAPAMSPIISVRDPKDPGDPLEDGEQDALAIGIARLHYGTLLRGMGYSELSELIIRAAQTPFARRANEAVHTARELAERLRRREFKMPPGESEPRSPLIGAFVTRAGPLGSGLDPTPTEAATFVRSGLPLSFVGVEWDTLRAAIDGDSQKLDSLTRAELKELATSDRTEGEDREEEGGPLEDGSGVWSINLDADGASFA